MTGHRWFRIWALVGGIGAMAGAAPPAQQAPHHEFTIVAHRYAFEPPRLEVHQNDLVRITLRAADIPHSFVVDTLRIFKRVTPGHEVTFEFLADRSGEVPYYCSLTIEDGCRHMIGRLVVRPESDHR
jgi:heme/copper-type cytochrome/quinol oxidase subunit 2